jgi:hypothetical protein
MHNQLDGRKSSALTPLLWLVLLLVVLTSIVAGAKYGPPWVVQAAVVLVIVVVGAFLLAYFLFALKNPDLLRSEHYSLSKLAIQQGVRGDSISGTIDHNQREPPSVFLESSHNDSPKSLPGGSK